MTKFNDIKIPKNIKEETRKTIQKGRSLKGKKKQNLLKVASVIILSLGICIGTLDSAIAREIPFFNDFFNSVSIEELKVGNYTNYTEGINLTKTVNGVSITINEILYDGHKIYFTYTIKSKEKLPRQTKEGFYKDSLMLDIDLDIKNGSAIENSGSTDGYIDDYTYSAMLIYDISFNYKKIPKSAKINLNINSIYINQPDSEEVAESIEGPFTFNLKLSPATDVIKIDVNEKKNGFTVKSLEITPYTVNVNVKFPKKLISKDKDSSVELKSTYAGMYETAFDTKYYNSNNEDNPDEIEPTIKGGIVYDSILSENIHKIGYYKKNDYIVVRFLNFENQGKDEYTEFKINIDRLLKRKNI